jgi:predicted transcriptional regulator of viral defense system
MNHLTKKGEIKKITRGAYTFKEEIEVVGFAFSPFYYGLQEALSLRNLWEQEVNPVVITPRKIRQGVRKFLGNNYLIKRVNRSMFFGFEMIKYYEFWIPVSDVEKTLIDFVYFKQALPKETIEEIKQQIRDEILFGYLKRVPKWVKKRVLKLLSEK